MKSQVLQAIKSAFNPTSTEEHLKEVGDRVLGAVKVIGSNEFDRLDDIRRQQRLWKSLVQILGDKATLVGPIVLEPLKRA